MRKSFILLILFISIFGIVVAYSGDNPLQLQILEEETISDTGIKLFDVNNVGSFAIAFSRESSEEIRIYNSNGRYQFSYNFFPEGDYAMKLNDEYSISILATNERFMATYDSNGNLTDLLIYESDEDTFVDIYEEMKQENLLYISGTGNVTFKDVYYNDGIVHFTVSDGDIGIVKASSRDMSQYIKDTKDKKDVKDKGDVKDEKPVVPFILGIAAFLIFTTALVIFILKRKRKKSRPPPKQLDKV